MHFRLKKQRPCRYCAATAAALRYRAATAKVAALIAPLVNSAAVPITVNITLKGLIMCNIAVIGEHS